MWVRVAHPRPPVEELPNTIPVIILHLIVLVNLLLILIIYLLVQANNSSVGIVLPLRGGGGERNEVERTTKTKVQANTAITINTIIHNSVIAGVKKIVCNRFPLSHTTSYEH